MKGMHSRIYKQSFNFANLRNGTGTKIFYNI